MRTIRPLPIIALAGLAAAVGSFFVRARPGPRTAPPDGPPTVIVQETVEHLATPEMVEGSLSMVDRVAPAFARTATDGERYSLQEQLRRGPVVLIFMKIGCPCSEAAQPYFNRLRAAYRRATFLGVINGEIGPAKLWVSRHRPSYSLLLDPDLELVRAYGVENSAYVVLVDASGRIAGHWPGYSGPMLRELGAMLARLSGSEETPLDLSDAPDLLYTGCPYDL